MYKFLFNVSNITSTISRFINSKLFLISCIATGLMTIPTTIDVIGSLFFNKALSSSIELVEFLQVLMLFGALGFIHDRRGHVYVEMILDRLPSKWRSAIRFAFIGVASAVFILMAWRLVLTGLARMENHEVSYALQIPECIFVLFAAFGAIAAAISFFADITGEMASLIRDKSWAQIAVGIALLVALLCLPII